VHGTGLVAWIKVRRGQNLDDETHRLLQDFTAFAGRSVQQSLRCHRRVEELLVNV